MVAWYKSPENTAIISFLIFMASNYINSQCEILLKKMMYTIYNKIANGMNTSYNKERGTFSNHEDSISEGKY